MHDGEFLPALEEVLERNGGFGHRQHLELAWRYLSRTDPGSAEHLMSEAIRHVATSHGTPEKYHETLTITWVRLVAAHMSSSDPGSFDEFIAANSDLLDRRLPDRHFSTEAFWADGARRGWVEPDLLPLP